MLTWVPYLITAFLLIVVLLEYFLKHVATDRRTNKHKTLRRVLLGITIIGIITQQTLSSIKERQREQRSDENSKKTQTEVGAIKTNQLELGKTLQNLVSAISTNPSIDATKREAVIEANKQFEIINNDIGDLEVWEKNFNERKTLAQLQTSQAVSQNFQRSTPVFDYAVRKLETMIAEFGKKRNQTTLSDYKGFPSHAPDDAIQIAEIKLGTNALWNFQIWTKTYTDVSHLSNGWLLIAVGGNGVSATVKADGIGFAENYSGSVDDYKSCVDKALRDLIAGISVASKKTQTNNH